MWAGAIPSINTGRRLVDKKLDRSQQCFLSAQETDCVLGCIKTGESAPVLCSGESQMGVLHPELGTPIQNMDLLVEGIENHSCEDRLRDLGLFNLVKALERPYCSFSIYKVSYKTEGDIFLPRSVVTKWSNDFKHKEYRFRAKGMVTRRNWLLRKVVDAPY